MKQSKVWLIWHWITAFVTLVLIGLAVYVKSDADLNNEGLAMVLFGGAVLTSVLTFYERKAWYSNSINK